MENKIRIKQGDVVVMSLGTGTGNEKSGIRPVVVVSSSIINETSGNVIVAPLTSAENKIDEKGNAKLLVTQIWMSAKHYKFLDKHSIIQLEDIRSVSKGRVHKHLGELSESLLKQVIERSRYLFE
ncbi:type II toxin-antitoxin system PemK/MazF family toxin [Aerococcaceae bacterium zg-B36]|uniref:type II toxin-antitoxin system PemK/MazF family toxin n=1 Tax=Aerococcaceae bacterium zg-252 TaxID=2796928 RepID=UPI001BD811E4|nr:type II toxin-antitoxin system PemK/MazF family toxin [Aerococcaceae bacterium zg-B36]